ISVGWTSNCPANSLTVRSPLRAARATRALNAAVWTFRLPAITPPLLDHQSSLTGGPDFGVHYKQPRALVITQVVDVTDAPLAEQLGDEQGEQRLQRRDLLRAGQPRIGDGLR